VEDVAWRGGDLGNRLRGDRRNGRRIIIHRDGETADRRIAIAVDRNEANRKQQAVFGAVDRMIERPQQRKCECAVERAGIERDLEHMRAGDRGSCPVYPMIAGKPPMVVNCNAIVLPSDVKTRKPGLRAVKVMPRPRMSWPKSTCSEPVTAVAVPRRRRAAGDPPTRPSSSTTPWMAPQ